MLNIIWDKLEGLISMDKNILVFSFNHGFVETLQSLFAGENLNIQGVFCLEEVPKIVARGNIHLILLDLELNSYHWSEGVEVIQYFKKSTDIPLIVISGQASETGEILALEYGADDYVALKDNPLVLLARMKSHIRRNQCVGSNLVYRVGELEVNDKNRTVSIKGEKINLTPIEYKILRLLMKEQGNVLSISEIYESIWQTEAIGADKTIPVHIRHIREKIEPDPKKPCYVKLVWGFGYKVG